MKRVFASSFLMVYVLAVIGLSLNLHYCGGKLARVSLASHAKDCEGKSVAKEDAKCCKNTLVNYKVKDDQKASPQFQTEKAKMITLFHHPFLDHFAGPSTEPEIAVTADRGPPPQYTSAIFLRNCTFRI
ncbi:MAG: hypothetical protein INR69_04230 [Mucilaginibacter polytrichastri]|nr:hypothetical protein [Mucilaginibacter polytrichastri]